MAFTYDQIKEFMLAYFPAYSTKAQDPEQQKAMDEFYAPDILLDDGIIVGRDIWYKACLSHPDVVDDLTLHTLCIDVEQSLATALITARPTVRATGEVLVELKMHALYTLKETEDGKPIIARLQVFTESKPDKIQKLFDAFGMKM